MVHRVRRLALVAGPITPFMALVLAAVAGGGHRWT
jgi:hypothetical protein